VQEDRPESVEALADVLAGGELGGVLVEPAMELVARLPVGIEARVRPVLTS
jgi:hypothetical protein